MMKINTFNKNSNFKKPIKMEDVPPKAPVTAILLYEFKDPDLLNTALTHPSRQKNMSFQRLEFLGDRILAFHLSYKIFLTYEESDEGSLAVLFSNLVSANTISKITGPHILPYLKYTGAINNSIIADSFEAILAAIFLDGGDVKAIIELLWTPYINAHKDHNFKNPKNILQEITQNNCHYHLQPPVTSTTAPKFTIKVTTQGTTAIGEGRSKKEASENAAHNMIHKLQNLK